MPLDPQTLVQHFNKFKPVEGPTGKLVADVLELPGTNEIYIEPRSGAKRREVTQLAVALAKARPDAKVEYDFNAVYYPVSATDTPTDAYKRDRRNKLLVVHVLEVRVAPNVHPLCKREGKSAHVLEPRFLFSECGGGIQV